MGSISYEEFLGDVHSKNKESITEKYADCRLSESKGNKLDELLGHLEREDAFAVWQYIANAEEGDLKEMDDLSVCQRNKREKSKKQMGELSRWQKFKADFKKQCPDLSPFTGCNKETKECISLSTEEQQEGGKISKEEREQRWLEILSNPLYIGLKWLWCTNQENSTTNVHSDVIARAISDSHRLEELAEYEHHYSRDDYLVRASRLENFAAGVVEQGNWRELLEVMDTEGTGPLIDKDKNIDDACDNSNYGASISLLKTATEKGRKKFAASPRCQSILNDIIYKDPCWQDRNLPVKLIWAVLIQLPLVAVFSLIYVPCHLAHLYVKRVGCSNWLNLGGRCKWCCCRLVRNTFEHPYSKFVNHTTGYLAFLCVIGANTFETNFETSLAGLSTLDFVILAFVLGFFVVELLEVYRQGFVIYYSKWWNVVDTLIIVTFIVAYVLWFIAWGANDNQWKPRSPEFIWADMIYASASVMAFFHLAHVFQVNSTLGPLQLSLYKMLKDVLKFLLIFLLLYFAFFTGMTKIYTYYVAAQNKLRKQNEVHYDISHSYEKSTNTLLRLFWLLIGFLEAENVEVRDPAFTTTQVFGTIYLSFYIIFMVIVALSMLISMMSNSFNRIMQDSDVEWKFSRTRMWLEWIDKGNSLPTPLSNVLYLAIPCLIIWGIRWLCKKIFSQKKEKDHPPANGLEQRSRGHTNQAISSSEVELGMPTTPSTGQDDNTENKDHKKARIETIKKLVVRYLVKEMKKKNEEGITKTAQKRDENSNDNLEPLEMYLSQTVLATNENVRH